MGADAGIQRTEVNGIPVFRAPATGSLTRAALLFRAGTVDETLPTHGITHMVEHMAVRGAAGRPYQFNAFVEQTRTIFWLEGSTADTADFLKTITEAISQLPFEHLEDERQVLRTEEESHPAGSLNGRLSSRFGATGYGLHDYFQYGLRWLQADALRVWVSRWFNASNCALWVHGDVPDGLELNLPPGERRSVPAIEPMRLVMPTITDSGRSGLTISLLGDRSIAMVAAARIIAKRAHMRVRVAEALSYAVGAEYYGLDNEAAELIAFADPRPENLREATVSLLEVIREFGASGPTPEELLEILESRRREGERPERTAFELDRAATDHITGFKRPNWDESTELLAALAPSEVAAAVAKASEKMIVIVPEQPPIKLDGLTEMVPSQTQIGTVRINPMPGKKNPDTLYFGPEGTSLVTPGDRKIFAMKWDDVAAALWWNDGRRSLLAKEGIAINFFPDRWQQANVFAAAIKEHVPADRWVPMDEAGTLGRKDEPFCQICEATPATEVHLSRWGASLRPQKVIGVLCRDCGIAEYRRCTASMFWWVWIPWLVLRSQWLATFATNRAEYRRVAAMATPVRTSGKSPLNKGFPVYLRPSMIVPLGVLGVLAAIVVFIARA